MVPTPIDALAAEQNKVVDIALGDNHCLALTQDCAVYAWGMNTVGQCGFGHVNSPICVPHKVKALSGVPVRQISAGTSHSMAWTAMPSDRYENHFYNLKQSCDCK